MIPKISRGSDPAGLVKYLFGKGRHNEHANQHLVACSDDLLDSFGFDGHPDESYAKIGNASTGATGSGNAREIPSPATGAAGSIPAGSTARTACGTVPLSIKPARASPHGRAMGKRSSATIWNAWASWTATPRQA